MKVSSEPKESRSRPDLLALPAWNRRQIVVDPTDTLIKDGRKKPAPKKSNCEGLPFGGQSLQGLSNTA